MKPWPPQSTKQAFERTFKVPFTRFWNPVTGLDIIALDDQVIKAPDGVSCSEQILAVYGAEAVTLVKGLLSHGMTEQDSERDPRGAA